MDTVGSMTENMIMRSVNFARQQQSKSKTLFGSSVAETIKHPQSQVNNSPEPRLLPTMDNYLRYTAIYSKQMQSNFNVTHIYPLNTVRNIFSANYSDSVQLIEDPTIAPTGRHESDYSMYTSEENDGYPHLRDQKEKFAYNGRSSSSEDENDSYI